MNKGYSPFATKIYIRFACDIGMSGCKPLFIPMAMNLKLSAYDEAKDKKEDMVQDVERYRRLIGKLIYLTATRPDIYFSM